MIEFTPLSHFTPLIAQPSSITNQFAKKIRHSSPRRIVIWKIFLIARALNASVMLRMVPPVLPHSFAAFGNEIQNFFPIFARKSNKYWQATEKKLLTPSYRFYYSHMVPPVLPRRLAAFWKKNEAFQMSHEILNFGWGRKISYEKAWKKNE